MNEQTILKHKLEKLIQDHKNVDEQIERIMHTPIPDQLAVQRLKRTKLSLKEEIVSTRSRIIPDIIA